MPTILRITTVPISLQLLLKGQFRYMKDNGYNVITISADGAGVADVKAEGVEHIAIPFTRQITPLQDLQCLYALIKVIRRTKPDIIHTHTPKAGLIGMLAAWICRTPIRMHTVAGLPLMEATGTKRRILEMTEWLTYATAHRVYPNSYGLMKFMKDDLKVNPSRMSIIGRGSSNGIDVDNFTSTTELKAEARSIRERYDIRATDIVFSFVGRVVKDKGIVEMVRAFQQIVDGQQAATDQRHFLMIVGPFEEDLDPLPADVMTFLKTNKSVILAGFQKDVRPWLIASDIFLFPSYREGFPNVVMQASLLELPCIVSDINGCNEIIQHGVTGLIVPPKSDTHLLTAMRQLAADPAMRREYATKARAFVAEHYDRRNVWAAIRNEYERLMSSQTDKR